ncbi:sulfotransferase family protein [Nitzschia inconspicua]|uniref:Sulfotransferase family protein n=1 Tax=Nitzschia inconspicua TaxID=303405 RepID=A0A9K3LDI7_9STRA|nr:sulfotransferase family protein [Nitzschia inconspicua]
MKRMSITSIDSSHPSSKTNIGGGRFDGFFSRVKKFQICIWVTVAITFLHLGTKPMVTPPEQTETKNKTRIPSTTTPPSLSQTQTTPSTTPFPSATSSNQIAGETTKSDVSRNSPNSSETYPSTSTTQSSNPRPTVKTPTLPPQNLQERPLPDIDPSTFTIHQSEHKKFDTLPPQTKAFVERYCDLKNLKEGAWYPSGDDEWQLRAPYLIIAGTWNSGVNHLAQALLKHPQIDSAKIHGFFLPKTFKKFITVTAKATHNSNSSSATTIPVFDATTKISKVQVFAARDRMYHAVYSPSSLQDTNATDIENDKGKSKNKHVAMDISPGLLFHARTTSYSIQCVSPWTKTVVLLRNPIDRLYQQWVYSKVNLNLMLPLDDWIAREMQAMQSIGLIGDGKRKNDNPESTSPALSQEEAWKRYQAVSRSGAPLGRSMYVIQLNEWIQAYLDAGKNPAQEMIIISSEKLEDDPSKELDKVIDFLGLAPLNVTKNYGVASTIMKPSQMEGIEPMSKDTRRMLQQFFKRYNRELAKLLKANGFAGDWDKIWE